MSVASSGKNWTVMNGRLKYHEEKEMLRPRKSEEAGCVEEKRVPE